MSRIQKVDFTLLFKHSESASYRAYILLSSDVVDKWKKYITDQGYNAADVFADGKWYYILDLLSNKDPSHSVSFVVGKKYYVYQS